MTDQQSETEIDTSAAVMTSASTAARMKEPTRRTLAEDVRAWAAKPGNEIEQVPSGVSGLVPGQPVTPMHQQLQDKGRKGGRRRHHQADLRPPGM